MPGWLQMVLRIAVAALVVAPPAFLLGATLPAMVRHWVRRTGETGSQTAWLYGINTTGAVVGCLATLPFNGLSTNTDRPSIERALIECSRG